MHWSFLSDSKQLPNLLDFETIATIMENTEEPDVDNESEKGIGSASVLPTLSIFCPKETFGIFDNFVFFGENHIIFK